MENENQDPRQEIINRLFAPFSVDHVKFRVGNQLKKECGPGLAYFNVYVYIDKETIQDRLDEVVGPFNWAACYNQLNNSSAIVCDLKIVVDGLECVKQGVGGVGEQMKDDGNKMKSAFTTAFRAAAGEWGFDRFLDRIPKIVWAGVVKKNHKQDNVFSYWQDEAGLRKIIAKLIEREAAGELPMAEVRRGIWWKPANKNNIQVSSEPEDMPIDSEPAPASAKAPAPQAQAPRPTPPPAPPVNPPAQAQATEPEKVESILSRKAKAFVSGNQVKVIEPRQKWAVGIEAVGQVINYVSLTEVDGEPSSFCPCMDFFEGRQNDKKFQCAHTLAVRYYEARQARQSEQKAS